jgi:hypothetical protein
MERAASPEYAEHEEFEEAQEQVERPRELPPDLPRSLDDRKNFRSYNEETEYYDAWQGTLHHQLSSRMSC